MIRAGQTLARCGRFARDEAGAVLVLWIMSLVAVLGFVALVYDMGRVHTTHGDLQNFADSVALAAAGELDGNANAITRANNAAAEVADEFFGGGADELTYNLRYVTTLPADDETPIPLSSVTTTNALAAFAWVQVDAENVGVSFLGATRRLLNVSGGSDMAVTAEAVAGYTIEACDITPLMFCVPSQTPAWTADANVGQAIKLRSGGNSAAWLPGAFGFLDITGAPLGPACENETGVKGIVTCVLGAEEDRTLCYSQRSVDVEPGQKVGIYNDAFNIRFDWFGSDLNQLKSDPNFTAAPNIVQGISVDCNNITHNENTEDYTSSDSDSVTANDQESMGLPPDTCFASGTCDRFGDGNWDYEAYVDKNHGNNDGSFAASEDDNFASSIPSGMEGSLNNTDPPTRYGVYLGEYAAAGSGSILGNPRIETGVAQCGTRSTDTYRRVVTAAAIDCTSFAADTTGSTKTGLPVLEFVELFMISPVGEDTGTSGSFDFWVEVIGRADVGSGGGTAGAKFRSFVQLYR